MRPLQRLGLRRLPRRRLGARVLGRHPAHQRLGLADAVLGGARQDHRAHEEMAEKPEPLVERGDPRLVAVKRQPMLVEQPLDLRERRLGPGAALGQNDEIVGEPPICAPRMPKASSRRSR